MDNINQLIENISNAKEIIVISHVNPDGDTLGSNLALNLFIKKYFNKQVTSVYVGALPLIYSFLPQYECMVNAADIDPNTKYDLAIAIDVASKDRMNEALKLFENSKVKINIDHHKTNILYGDLNYVDGDACSAGFILADILEKADYQITKEMADCLYISILTDTGCFKYENTTAEVFETIAKIVRAGASPKELYKKCYEVKPKNMVQFQAYILNNAKFLFNGKFAYVLVRKEDMKKFNAKDDYTEGIVEVIRTIETVEVAAILKETDENYTKVSLRSKSLNLIPMVSDFNGGGHVFAAGCTIKKPLDIAFEKLSSRIKRELS